MPTKALKNSISGQLSIWRLLLAAGLSVLLLSACAVAPSADIAASAAAGLPETELAAYASAPRLDFSAATVLLDNDEAFEQKLQAVRNARKSLDLAYYIFADDYSSSLLAQELVAAARRGVRVRVVVPRHGDIWWFKHGARRHFAALLEGGVEIFGDQPRDPLDRLEPADLLRQGEQDPPVIARLELRHRPDRQRGGARRLDAKGEHGACF